MKRTITIRVEVNDEQEYAEVIANLLAHTPQATTWGFTSMSKELKHLLEQQGVEARYAKGSVSAWVKANS